MGLIVVLAGIYRFRGRMLIMNTMKVRLMKINAGHENGRENENGNNNKNVTTRRFAINK